MTDYKLIHKFFAGAEDLISTAVGYAPKIVSDQLYRFYEGRLRRGFAKQQLPEHVAVLADGNRRWARANAPGETLEVGYKAGADKLRQFVNWCQEIDIPIVTLWVLSTDNLQRSQKDVLLPLLHVIVDLVDSLAAEHRVKIVGDLSLLPDEISEKLSAAQERSEDNPGIHINVAVSYGGRHELISAFKDLLIEEANAGKDLREVAETLSLEQVESHLYTKGQPDPDLIIRTSGEQRLSGFLMWQSAHSEFYFCEALWPDFRRVDFYRALRSYGQRERRFGK
ncbi:polyprenyl diphosphate synthase [Propionimicrobium lymphophilum]|uniref:polyprenyl diphosphate synthase n=1 Tax=Propionimicrobium lymphophilum TaxID=33012 RepID=UPI00288ACF58|nr:polyprenyl diphosphate synthase [Propionimicrobium lymphophilum]